ncbi:alpha/beta hydrolase-fold protein [Demequina sp.]|uniref:alpha/beta hydrolase-fold protein n=1 Tax=Demequina sp. TaxID=2050685 RepID=UPI003A862326
MAHRARLSVVTLAVASTLTLAACSADAAGDSEVVAGPVVTATGSSPTGYEVTFRYADDEAEQVWLAGDLYFTTPDLVSVMGAEQSWLGDEWLPGDVSASPQAQDLAQMTQNDDGVWELTMAIPAGMWNYGFVTAPCDFIHTCAVAADPANVPTLSPTDGVGQAWSQVYVPVDPDHPTYAASGQVPASAELRGTLDTITYDSPDAVDPAGEHQLGVYLPADYDPDRTRPYPMLVLSHGAGDDETGWWTQGGAATQLDHAIAESVIEPTVVVTTNFMGLSESGMEDPDFFDLYAADLIDNVLPTVEARFNVTTACQQRAFAGLSMGAKLAEHLMLNRPGEFCEFGLWSTPAQVAPVDPTSLSQAQLAGLGAVDRVHLGTGLQDELVATPATYEAWAGTAATAGAEVSTLMIDGGHTWWVWRQMLGDFLSTSQFAQ